MKTPLRLIREARGFSQKDVARAIGIDPANLWRIESGKQTPKPKVARKLFDFYDGWVDLGEIYDPEFSAKQHGNRWKGGFSQRNNPLNWLYKRWAGMIQRCENERDKDFVKYGARGISVCYEWRISFEQFIVDMGIPEKGLSIDRKDNNGNYEPENCQWATSKEQRNNQRGSLLLHNGLSLTREEWSARTGIKQKTINERLRLGW